MENKKTIQIFRFGNYINQVETEEELRKWLVANLPYKKGEMDLPEDTPLHKCMKLAKEMHFSFTTGGMSTVTYEEMSRLGRILNDATFPEVAADLGLSLGKKGHYYICKCPTCKGDGTVVLSPKHGVYKCFACGETGNVINFVREVRGIGSADALNYLESKYSKQ